MYIYKCIYIYVTVLPFRPSRMTFPLENKILKYCVLYTLGTWIAWVYRIPMGLVWVFWVPLGLWTSFSLCVVFLGKFDFTLFVCHLVFCRLLAIVFFLDFSHVLYCLVFFSQTCHSSSYSLGQWLKISFFVWADFLYLDLMLEVLSQPRLYFRCFKLVNSSKNFTHAWKSGRFSRKPISCIKLVIFELFPSVCLKVGEPMPYYFFLYLDSFLMKFVECADWHRVAYCSCQCRLTQVFFVDTAEIFGSWGGVFFWFSLLGDGAVFSDVEDKFSLDDVCCFNVDSTPPNGIASLVCGLFSCPLSCFFIGLSCVCSCFSFLVSCFDSPVCASFLYPPRLFLLIFSD